MGGLARDSMPMKKDYPRFVELSNKGATRAGFTDTGAMWRGKYDMPPEAFAKEIDRLWDQLRPLYVSLHAYVRTACARNTAHRSRPTDRFRPTCSATSGSRTGRTSIRSSRRQDDARRFR